MTEDTSISRINKALEQCKLPRDMHGYVIGINELDGRRIEEETGVRPRIIRNATVGYDQRVPYGQVVWMPYTHWVVFTQQGGPHGDSSNNIIGHGADCGPADPNQQNDESP